MDTDNTLCGVEQPKRIWLMVYRHAGDVCWTSDPNPEDADEIETVEYVRADQASQLSGVVGERALDIMADLECALVLTSEHAPTATVCSFVDSSIQFKRLADFLRERQYDTALSDKTGGQS